MLKEDFDRKSEDLLESMGVGEDFVPPGESTEEKTTKKAMEVRPARDGETKRKEKKKTNPAKHSPPLARRTLLVHRLPYHIFSRLNVRSRSSLTPPSHRSTNPRITLSSRHRELAMNEMRVSEYARGPLALRLRS